MVQRGRLGCDIGAGTRAVFYDELLAEPLRQPLTHQASDDVDSAAGSKPAIQRTCRVEEPSTASEPVMSQLHDGRIR